MAIELAYPAEEAVRILELIEHECEQSLVIAVLGELRRNLPQGKERLIVGGDLALPVHHQNPIRRGIDRRLQEGESRLQIPCRVLQLGHVPTAADDSERLATFVGDHIAASVQHAYAAIRPDDAMVVHERLDASEGVEQDILRMGEIVRMNALEKSLVGAVELALLYSVDPMELVGPGHDVGLDLPLEATDVSDALCLLDPASACREL